MNIEDFLKELEKEARENSFPIIGPAKANTLKNILDKKKPKKVLEIGALRGYSAIKIASFLPEGSKLITIEIDPRSADIAKENIQRAGLSDRVKVLTGDALDIIPDMKDDFDFVFLDANKENYLKYLNLLKPKLRNNTTLVADNVKIFSEEVEDYLDHVKKKYDSKTLEIGNDAMEITKITSP